MSWICPTCGESHEGVPLDVAFTWPDAYLRVPRNQREERCWANRDACVIDEARWFLRCVLEVPVRDAREVFGWGLWAEVSRPSFDRALEVWNADARGEPAFEARVANEVKGYEGLEGAAAIVQLQDPTTRPLLSLKPSEHLLYREQVEGISLHRAGEIVGLVTGTSGRR